MIVATQDVAITQNKKLADNAQTTADVAQTVADVAQTTAVVAQTTATNAEKVATQAQQTASNALTSANGKNTNYYSINIPVAGKSGDLWFKKNNDGTIIGMYSYDGVNWTNTVDLASIDMNLARLDTINQSVIDTNVKVSANETEIAATKSNLIGNSGNLIINPQLTQITNSSHTFDLSNWRIPTTYLLLAAEKDKPYAKIIDKNNTASSFSTVAIPVSAITKEQKVMISFDYKLISGTFYFTSDHFKVVSRDKTTGAYRTKLIKPSESDFVKTYALSTIPVDGSWYRLSFLVTLPANTDYFYFSDYANTLKSQYRDFKISMGESVTQFTTLESNLTTANANIATAVSKADTAIANADTAANKADTAITNANAAISKAKESFDATTLLSSKTDSLTDDVATLNQSTTALQSTVATKASQSELTQTATDLTTQIKDKVSTSTFNQTKDALTTQISDKVSTSLLNQTATDLTTKISDKASISLLNQTKDSLTTQITDKVSTSTFNQTKDSLTTQIGNKADTSLLVQTTDVIAQKVAGLNDSNNLIIDQEITKRATSTNIPTATTWRIPSTYVIKSAESDKPYKPIIFNAASSSDYCTIPIPVVNSTVTQKALLSFDYRITNGSLTNLSTLARIGYYAKSTASTTYVNLTLKLSDLTTSYNLTSLGVSTSFYRLSFYLDVPANTDYVVIESYATSIRSEEWRDFKFTMGETLGQISLLKDNINLKVAKNEIVNQINVSTEGILIDGKKTQITGDTYIANGVIKNANILDGTITNAKISNLDASKITTGYIDAARINAKSITTDKLNVTSLSALNSNLGNVTAGNIKGVSIESSTLKTVGTADAEGSIPFTEIKSGTIAFGNTSDTTSIGKLNYSELYYKNDLYSYDGYEASTFDSYAARMINYTNGGGEVGLGYKLKNTIDYTATGIYSQSEKNGKSTNEPFNFWGAKYYDFDNTIRTNNSINFASSDGVDSMYIKTNGIGISTAGTYTNLYLKPLGEVRVTSATDETLSNYMPVRASEFLTGNGDAAYINGSGGGTLNSGKFLQANGIVTGGTAFYLGLDSALHVTDKKGYNSGGTVSYRPIRSSIFYGWAVDTTATNFYVRPLKGGELRVTVTDTTDSYLPVRASAFTNASSYNLKQDISEMNRSALDVIDAVKVYEYRYIGDVDGGKTDNWKLGLIAEYSPQVATTDGTGVDVYKMASMNWKATQELYQRSKGDEVAIEMLTQQVDEQQQLIESLQQQISEIKALLS